jgi:hypothetical protein
MAGGKPVNNRPDDNAAAEGPGSSARSGIRRIISPWEYRHLRFWAGVRIGAGTVLAGLGIVTLGFGGNDAKTYGWTMAFLALAAANVAFARWELAIARSQAGRG